MRLVAVMALSMLSACGGASIVGEFAGAIDGRTERFAVGIDAVAESGAVRGWLRIGEPPEGGFPAPRAEVGYPEGTPPDELAVLVDNGVAGFEHPLRGAGLIDRALSASISFTDFWADWCGLLDGDPAVGKRWVVDPAGCSVDGVAADCGKLALLEVLGVCTCSPNGCDVASNLSGARMALTVDDNDHLRGTFSRASGTLRLTRVR